MKMFDDNHFIFLLAVQDCNVYAGFLRRFWFFNFCDILKLRDAAYSLTVAALCFYGFFLVVTPNEPTKQRHNVISVMNVCISHGKGVVGGDVRT